MVATMMIGNISLCVVLTYLSSLKPNTVLSGFLVDDRPIVVPIESISTILFLVVPLDEPLGDDNPAIMVVIGKLWVLLPFSLFSLTLSSS
jgi:hypothetical protein